MHRTRIQWYLTEEFFSFFFYLKQVDYIHCLVPDLKRITNCSFYWGKMDRYEAERLLDGKPEGTFEFDLEFDEAHH